jgi:stress-induced morphogen
MISASQVQKLIQQGLPDAEVEVFDPMNDGTHLEARVISPSFHGKTRVRQHQMVYQALGAAFEGPLHALKLTTMTPEEAKNRR